MFSVYASHLVLVLFSKKPTLRRFKSDRDEIWQECWRVQFKLYCMMHSVFHGIGPAYLANIVHPTSAGRFWHCLRSASSTGYSLQCRDCVLSLASAPFLTLDLLHGMHSQRTYVPTMIGQFLGNNSKLTFYLSFKCSLTARFRLLLYRVGDCVMHLCPICNRRTRNVLDDDDEYTHLSWQHVPSLSTTNDGVDCVTNCNTVCCTT